MSERTPRRPSDGRADDGRPTRGEPARTSGGADNRWTDRGPASGGRTSSGRTSGGRTDSGRTDTGRTDSGRTDSGRTSTGRTSIGTSSGREDTRRAGSGREAGGRPDGARRGGSRTGAEQARTRTSAAARSAEFTAATPARGARSTGSMSTPARRARSTEADPDPDSEAAPTRRRSRSAERVRPGGPGLWPVEERSLITSVLGVPPLAAVGVAAGLTALGVTVDLLRAGTLGAVFTICYLTGCVLAVAWVRRDGLFWPMVVPPLLMAVAVPVVVLLSSTKPGAGVAERLLVIGAPLVNGFPIMAWTTGLALAVGVFRMMTQRLRREPAAARAAARTSGSPRRW